MSEAQEVQEREINASKTAESCLSLGRCYLSVFSFQPDELQSLPVAQLITRRITMPKQEAETKLLAWMSL